MKKKGKTKRIITVCITVVMMLCIFIIPSNAATYQPTEDYKIETYIALDLEEPGTVQQIVPIRIEIHFVINKLYKIEENNGDIFEYEAEKSLFTWTTAGVEAKSSRIEYLNNDEKVGYKIYAEEGIMYIGRNIESEETVLQVSYDEGRTYTDYIGTVKVAEAEYIQKITPPSFVETTTTTMGVVLSWIALPITALLEGDWNPLLIMFGIGIAISGIFIAIKLIKKFIWGD